MVTIYVCYLKKMEKKKSKKRMFEFFVFFPLVIFTYLFDIIINKRKKLK